MENMKPSGIEWIGDIPEHWKVKRVKYLIENSSEGIKVGPFGSSLTNEVIGEADGAYKIYGQANLIRRDFGFGDNYVSEQTYQVLKNYEVIEGDVLLSMMGTIGKCCIVPANIVQGIMDSHLIKARLLNDCSSEFFEEFYESDVGYAQLLYNCKGSIMNGLNSAIIKNVYFTVPPLYEQTLIANFLDEQCGKIDSIIADIEKQIEILGQYKKSLITEAVTKGLDKNAPMKDSGIEWIGDIPEHWEVKPIKYKTIFFNGDRGENYPSKSEMQSDGIPFINAGHLLNGGLDIENLDYITLEKYKAMGGVKLQKDDILYCLRGSIGKNSIISINKGTVASSLVAMRSIGILARYLYYSINSNIEEVQRFLWDNGTAQPNLSAENLGKFKICLPDYNEQTHIVNYLDKQCLKIDSIIESKKEQLDKITEHKKSLIYEYVTGKKRVKGAVTNGN